MNFLSQFRGLLFMMVVATACTSGAYSAEEPTSDYVLPSGAIAAGGHVFEAIVSPTLEVFVTADPIPLNKKVNTETGLALIDPQSK
jgi:hypothetical protein